MYILELFPPLFEKGEKQGGGGENLAVLHDTERKKDNEVCIGMKQHWNSKLTAIFLNQFQNFVPFFFF